MTYAHTHITGRALHVPRRRLGTASSVHASRAFNLSTSENGLRRHDTVSMGTRGAFFQLLLLSCCAVCAVDVVVIIHILCRRTRGGTMCRFPQHANGGTVARAPRACAQIKRNYFGTRARRACACHGYVCAWCLRCGPHTHWVLEVQMCVCVCAFRVGNLSGVQSRVYNIALSWHRSQFCLYLRHMNCSWC